jgi:hypothetical protein
MTSAQSGDGYAVISECRHIRIHWTVAFPVTGLMTTTRGPPVAFNVTVALLAGAVRLVGCPLVSNSI